MTLYNKDSPETIKSMFGSIAQNYDRTNAIMSMSMHRLWNASLVRNVIVPKQPASFLDLCCGTGDIACAYLNQTRAATQTYMLDFCQEMLDFAKDKVKKMGLDQRHGLTYLQADAQKIPLHNESIDCATISYGIRNVKVPAACIQEVYRTLKPDGVFGILELTRPNHSLLRFFHSIYLTNILPLIGKVCASNQQAYQYLCNSIHSFVPVEELVRLMHQEGFKDIRIKPLLGGISTIVTGKKI